MDNGASSYRRYLDGDDKGLTEIVSEYKNGLMLYINQFVNNFCIAEELTEDTFFRLITKKPKFYGKSSFRSWLYAIGRNTAIDHIRRNSQFTDTPIEEMDNYISDGKSLEQSYITEESKKVLHSAMAKLTPDYRRVLWLVYFEDFSNSEVAAVMKKNDRQIKNLLYRAKKSLKAELDKEGFTYENL